MDIEKAPASNETVADVARDLKAELDQAGLKPVAARKDQAGHSNAYQGRAV